MKNLKTIDYCIMGVYFLALLVMGLYLKARASKSMEDYFLGGKKLPWWLLGISGMGNFLDMSGTMLIVSFLFMVGPRGLYIEFRGGAVLILIFLLCWVGKWHRRSNCMTGAEWMAYRFGHGPTAQAARQLCAIVGITSYMFLFVYLIKGAGTFLSMFMPFHPMVCAAIMVGVTVAYTISSGFYGVVYSDLLQCGIILVSVGVVVVLTVGQLSGYDGTLATLAETVTGNPAWTKSSPAWTVPMPAGYEEFSRFMPIVFFYLLRNVLNGIGSISDPRYFGARNERECGILTFFWIWLMTFRWPMMMGFAVLGLFLVQDKFPDQKVIAESSRIMKLHLLAEKYPDPAAALTDANKVNAVIPKSGWEAYVSSIINTPERYPQLIAQLRTVLGDDWKDKLDLVGWEGTVNPERIVPAVLTFSVPAGLRGLFMIAFLAAAMSTFSPMLNAATAFFTRDVYQVYVHKSASNRELIGVSYLFGLFLTGISFLLAYSTDSINQIWNWINMGLGSSMLIGGLLRLYWWRFNAAGFMIGTAAGLVAAIVQWFVAPDMGTIKMFIIHNSITMVVTIVATLLTPPTEQAILEHFYKTTRPFGFWGRFPALLSPEQWAITKKEHRNDLLATPFTFIWQVTLFLLPMQALIGAWNDFFITLILFLIGLGGMYIFWYTKLPPAQAGVPQAV